MLCSPVALKQIVLALVIGLSQNRAVIAHNLAKLFVWYIKIQ